MNAAIADDHLLALRVYLEVEPLGITDFQVLLHHYAVKSSLPHQLRVLIDQADAFAGLRCALLSIEQAGFYFRPIPACKALS